MRPAAQILFPPFRLDLSDERLYGSEGVVALRPKTFAVLRHLLERPGALVTKDELQEVVWPGVSVGDSVLKACIREIRDALQDDPLAPRFLQTAQRRGYRFVGVVAGATPLQSPRVRAESCVGRAREIARLREWLDRSLQGERRVVFVTGDAGIGKTALVHSFLEDMPGSDGTIVGYGKCLEEYGAFEAYLPFLEAFGRLCRQPDAHRVVALLDRYAPTWLVQMPGVAPGADIEVLQRRVAGATSRRMLRELAEAIEALTKDAPLVLLIEDLQWADVSTLDLLASLAERSDAARLLLIATYNHAEPVTNRHPLKALAERLQMHRRAVELPVAPLTAHDVGAYLNARFGVDRFPAELAQAIHGRTDGHPLFIVDMVDDLVMSGAIGQGADGWELRALPSEVANAIPESLRGMLERQVDLLSGQERSVMEAASVAGMEFSSIEIATVIEDGPESVEACCDALVRRHLFVESRPAAVQRPGIAMARYRFRHALHRRALYEQIPLTRRVQLHHRNGAALERVHGDQAGEVAGELAHQFEQGGDSAKAAGYFQKAASNAARRFATHEVVALTAHGLQAVAELPDSVERRHQELELQMARGAALTAAKGYGAAEVEQAYTRARELCRLAGNASERFRVLWQLARFHFVRTPLATARELGQELLHLAGRSKERDDLQQAHNSLGATLFHLGDFDGARVHLEQSLALYEPDPVHAQVLLSAEDPGVVSHARSSLALWCLGYPDQAATRAQDALALARRVAHPFSEAFAGFVAAVLYDFRRDWAHARHYGERTAALSSEHGFAELEIMGLMLRAAAETALDVANAEGRAEIRRLLDRAQSLGIEFLRSYFLGLLARASAQAGRFDEGCEWLDQALTQVERTGERFYEAELHRLQGQLALQRAVPDADTRAEALFRTAIDLARRQKAKSWELRAAVSLARLYQTRGRPEGSADVLPPVYSWFSEGLDTADLQDARALLEARTP